jgi:hypothetical protein
VALECKEKLDSLRVGQNCTPEEYEAARLAYQAAMLQEYQSDEMFDQLVIGAGCLE